MKTYLFLILLVFVFFIPSHSQDEENSNVEEIRKRFVEIGVFGILGQSSHNANLQDNDVSNLEYCCPQFNSGSGFSWELGLKIEYPLFNNFALSARPSIRDLGGILQFDQSLERVNVNGFPQRGTSRHTLDTDLLTAGLSFFIDYEPIYLLNINAGFRISSFISNEFYYKERIIEPSNAIFREEGTKDRNPQTGEFEDLNPTMFSIELSVSYSIALDELNNNFLVPEIYYSKGLTDVLTTSDWKIDFFGFGLSYQFNLTSLNRTNISPINPD